MKNIICEWKTGIKGASRLTMTTVAICWDDKIAGRGFDGKGKEFSLLYYILRRLKDSSH